MREITAVDRGILELREAVRHLRAQVSGLQRSIDELRLPSFLSLRGALCRTNRLQVHEEGIDRASGEAQARGADVPPNKETDRGSVAQTLRLAGDARSDFDQRRDGRRGCRGTKIISTRKLN